MPSRVGELSGLGCFTLRMRAAAAAGIGESDALAARLGEWDFKSASSEFRTFFFKRRAESVIVRFEYNH